MATLFESFFYPRNIEEIAVDLAAIPWTVAAPSFVWPACLADNCRMLAQVFPEAALLFFETRACLDYGPGDLPDWLADLGLAYHLHLPLDLPWDQGPRAAFEVARALAAKAAFLKPRYYVLHPPEDPGDLAGFTDLWSGSGRPAGELAIENTRVDLDRHWQVVRARGLGVCLDLGHVLAYGQEAAFDLPGLAATLRLVHLCSPSPGQGASTPADGHGHHSLTRLDPAGRVLARRILAMTPPEATVVIEVFEPAGLCESVAALRDLCRGVDPAITERTA